MRKTDLSLFARMAKVMSTALLGERATHAGRNALSWPFVYSPLRPTGEALRDPSNLHQQACIQAAAAKRERRANKLTSDSFQSWSQNRAHAGCSNAQSLNPFFVVR